LAAIKSAQPQRGGIPIGQIAVVHDGISARRALLHVLVGYPGLRPPRRTPPPARPDLEDRL